MKKKNVTKDKKLVDRVILATTISVFAEEGGKSTKGDYLELEFHLGGWIAHQSFGFWISGTGIELKRKSGSLIMRIPIKKEFTTFSPTSMSEDGKMSGAEGHGYGELNGIKQK